MTISGQDFGSTGQLFVNALEVSTTSWADAAIVFTVPTGIIGTEIQIMLNSGGQNSTVFTVSYTEPGNRPVITSADPATVTEGTSVILHGQNFGPSGQLYIYGNLVATTFWSDSLIMFTVPMGLYGNELNVWVISNGQDSGSFYLLFTEATERQLTVTAGSVATPCWSADGSFIFFTADGPNGNTAFYSVPFNGGDVALLYDGPGNDRFLDIQYYQTGAEIWISDYDNGTNPGGDWEIRVGSGGFTHMGFLDSNTFSNTSNERFPVWNHSELLGVDCAWTQDREGGNSMIYVRRLANIQELVSGSLPCFRPGRGDVLAFLIPSPTIGYDIMTISLVPGSEPELLYRDENNSLGLAWGNAGQIAYVKNGYHIWIMDENGTNHRKLTDSPNQEANPKFSPNGNWVAFVRLVTTEYEVFVARVP